MAEVSASGGYGRGLAITRSVGRRSSIEDSFFLVDEAVRRWSIIVVCEDGGSVNDAGRPSRYAPTQQPLQPPSPPPHPHPRYDHVTTVFVCRTSCCGSCTLTSPSCPSPHLTTPVTASSHYALPQLLEILTRIIPSSSS